MNLSRQELEINSISSDHVIADFADIETDISFKVFSEDLDISQPLIMTNSYTVVQKIFAISAAKKFIQKKLV